jgi:N-methylhydantoinase A/oxoprolinase/acetone carboxylase beta subunit
MQPGSTAAGPAIVEAPLTTIVLPPGYQGTLDGFHNLIITPA